MEKHSVIIENRELITVTDVTGIDTFDEEEVCIQLSEGSLVIKGKQMHIKKLDLDEGAAAVSGEIRGLNYTRKSADKKVLKKFRK